MNREQWLEEAVTRVAPIFAPEKVPTLRVSCGWPSKRATSLSRRIIGQCWPEGGKDKRPQLFISPVLDSAAEVLSTLAHELCHAVVKEIGHRGPFVALGRRIGLEGKPSSMSAGPDLSKRLNALTKDLGRYPHSALVPSSSVRPGSRLRLYECGCPVKVRVASDEFDATCNDCGESFERQG
jgi:hypothetical protein